MARALEVGVRCFNVESRGGTRAARSRSPAALGRIAPVSIRVNPDVDAATHPYISTGLKQNKFGVACEEAVPAYRRPRRCPISKSPASTATSARRSRKSRRSSRRSTGCWRWSISCAGAASRSGISTSAAALASATPTRCRRDPMALMDALFSRIDKWSSGEPPEVLFEFGRALVGNAGLLLTRTEYLKSNHDKHFAIVDAAMNDLLRPSLYDAYIGIEPVAQRRRPAARRSTSSVRSANPATGWGATAYWRCEQGDLLAILSAGAYGAVMSSNYNTRPRAAEVLIDQRQGLRGARTGNGRGPAGGGTPASSAERASRVARCSRPRRPAPLARRGRSLPDRVQQPEQQQNARRCPRRARARDRSFLSCFNHQKCTTPRIDDQVDQPVQLGPAAAQPAHHPVGRRDRQRHQQQEGGETDGDERPLPDVLDDLLAARTTGRTRHRSRSGHVA